MKVERNLFLKTSCKFSCQNYNSINIINTNRKKKKKDKFSYLKVTQFHVCERAPWAMEGQQLSTVTTHLGSLNICSSLVFPAQGSALHQLNLEGSGAGSIKKKGSVLSRKMSGPELVE